MLKKLLSLIPDYIVFIQAGITFIVPFALSKFFKWLHYIEKE
ncbi:hypothetical protein [Gottfriedia endophytica]|nr:hypothetical protein [Gottfriedia endophytica]